MIEILEPPLPIRQFVYRCDKQFHTQCVESLFRDHDRYGVALICGDEAKLYSVQGTECELVESVTCYRINQKKCGGQSSMRFCRIRQSQIQEFIKKIEETVNRVWIQDGNVLQIKGLVIAGMAEIKDAVLSFESGVLHSKLKKALRASVNCSDQMFVIPYVLQQCSNILGECDVEQENKEIEQLLFKVADNPESANLMVYGRQEIEEALLEMQIRKLYVHQTVVEKYASLKELAKASLIETKLFTVTSSVSAQWLAGYDGILAECWFAN